MKLRFNFIFPLMPYGLWIIITIITKEKLKVVIKLNNKYLIIIFIDLPVKFQVE